MSNAELLRPWAKRFDASTAQEKQNDEEWANGLTHAVGFGLGVVGSVVLIHDVWQRGTTWQCASCVVYVASMLAVYAASTLSHWVREPIWRLRFRAWDQGLIYLFIAGNYTPFAVATNQKLWGVVPILIWTLAGLGFISKVAFRHRVEGIALWLYLGLGWMTALGLPHLIATAPFQACELVLAGGVAYTVGSVLLVNDHRAPFLHVGWHLLVIVGSVCHYVAVWQCLCVGT